MLDQRKATKTTDAFKIMLSKTIPKADKMTAAKTIGNIQYPSTHKHYKIWAFPPNKLQFTVTIREPPQIIKKIVANKLWLSSVDNVRTLCIY